MLNITVDGNNIEVEEGKTILEVARENGIKIPTLCHDENLTEYGGCRMCVVEIEGEDKLKTSCDTFIKDGMEIKTCSDKVKKARKTILDLLLSNHPKECVSCSKVGNCNLQKYAYEYGLRGPSYDGRVKHFDRDECNPVMIRDQDKCIMCGKCVRVCDEVQVTNAIDYLGKGFNTKVATAFDLPLNRDNCRFCGQCISACPTGALTNIQLKKERPWKVTKVKTTCPFCGTGCNFDLNVRDGKVVGVTPNKTSIVNGESLCVKGRYHIDLIHSEDRLTKPLMKKDGVFVEVSWEEALNKAINGLKGIKDDYGPDAIAGLSSARCTNEDNFIFQKMMRVGIGTNSVDHCART